MQNTPQQLVSQTHANQSNQPGKSDQPKQMLTIPMAGHPIVGPLATGILPKIIDELRVSNDGKPINIH